MLVAALLIAQTKQSKTSTLLTSPEIIEKMRAAVRAAIPITGTETITAGPNPIDVNFKLMYPSLVSESINYGPSGTTEIHWLGGPIFSYFGPTGYRADPPPATGKPIHLGLIGLENGFTDANLYQNIGSSKSEKFRGQRAYSVEVILTIGTHPSETLHIDAKTFLPLGCDEIDGDQKIHITYKDLATHAPLNVADFKWLPPTGTPKIN